jgi:hypothetical protein
MLIASLSGLDILVDLARVPTYFLALLFTGPALTYFSLKFAFLLRYIHGSAYRFRPLCIRPPIFLPSYRSISIMFFGCIWLGCWLLHSLRESHFSLEVMLLALIPWLVGNAGVILANSRDGDPLPSPPDPRPFGVDPNPMSGPPP